MAQRSATNTRKAHGTKPASKPPRYKAGYRERAHYWIVVGKVTAAMFRFTPKGLQHLSKSSIAPLRASYNKNASHHDAAHRICDWWKYIRPSAPVQKEEMDSLSSLANKELNKKSLPWWWSPKRWLQRLGTLGRKINRMA